MKHIKTKNAGITLIALVLTIIVLLILAGITINLTIGQDGIVKKAKDAEEKYKISKEIEELTLKLAESNLDNIISSKSENDIEKELEEIDGIEVIENEDGTHTIIKDGNIYIKDVNKKITYKGKVGDKKPKIEKITKNPSDTTKLIEEMVFTIEVSTEDEQGLSAVKIKKEYQTGQVLKYYTYRVKNIKGNKATVELTVRNSGKFQIYVYGKNGTYTTSEIMEINNIYPKPAKPVISVTSGQILENEWFISDIGVKIESTQTAGTRTVYTITGEAGEIDVKNGIQEFIINEDGIYEIVAYTVSEVGMYSDEARLTIKRDTTPPEEFVPVDGEGNGTGTQINIVANTEDSGSGVKEYKYYLNGKNITTIINEEYTIIGLQPFIEYELYVVAVDNVGKETQSETIKFNTGVYLYNNGDECIDITGGWRKIFKTHESITPVASSSAFSVTKNSTYINIKLQEGHSSQYPYWGATIGTTKRIDITNYKYMYTKATANLDKYAGAASVFMTLESDNPYNLFKEEAFICYTEPISKKTVGFDISENKGEYSPAIQIMSEFNCTSWANLYQIWLLK